MVLECIAYIIWLSVFLVLTYMYRVSLLAEFNCNLARPKKTTFLRTEGISEHTHGLFYLNKGVACIAAGPCTRPNHLFRVWWKNTEKLIVLFCGAEKTVIYKGLILSHILCSCFVLFFMDGELPIAFLLNFKSMPKRISQDNTNGEQGKLYKQCQINQWFE